MIDDLRLSLKLSHLIDIYLNINSIDTGIDIN